MFCNKRSLKNFARFTGKHFKIDLKGNFKVNLKIDSSSVVFSCESCKIFQNTYSLEHRSTPASAIDTDAKYSHLIQ